MGNFITAPMQTGLGIWQAISGRKDEKRATKELEKMVRGYQPSGSIMDFYNKALQKYNQNPYQSAMYQQADQNINRNTSAALASAQDRRGALAALPGVVQGANDAKLKAGAIAEQQQAQNLNQLGSATQLKDREDKYKFENLYNLISMKGGAGASRMNAGIQNIFSGINSNFEGLESALKLLTGGI